MVIWAWPEFLEFVFGHLRVREGVEIVEILEIWGLERVWKVEILESWPSKCLISSRVRWKVDPKPAETLNQRENELAPGFR